MKDYVSRRNLRDVVVIGEFLVIFLGSYMIIYITGKILLILLECRSFRDIYFLEYVWEIIIGEYSCKEGGKFYSISV